MGLTFRCVLCGCPTVDHNRLRRPFRYWLWCQIRHRMARFI